MGTSISWTVHLDSPLLAHDMVVVCTSDEDDGTQFLPMSATSEELGLDKVVTPPSLPPRQVVMARRERTIRDSGVGDDSAVV